MEATQRLLCAKTEEKGEGSGVLARSCYVEEEGGGGVDVRSAREVGVQCRQGRRRGGGGDRSEENRGAGRHAWAACGEHGLAGEEGKWAGPKRNTAVF
jgi:hypothetical protein